MEDVEAIAVMSALAQPTRLSVFRLLARAWPEGLTSSEIARHTGSPINTMSAHLAILGRAGIIVSKKEGRVVTSTLQPGVVTELSIFLIQGVASALPADHEGP